MALTRYAFKKLQDHLLGVASYTMPATYLALFTADPTADGLLANEVAGGAYARVALTANMAATNLTTGQAINSAIVLFPAATAAWGTITHYGAVDAATSGNLLTYTALSPALTVGIGDQLPIAEGSLVFEPASTSG